MTVCRKLRRVAKNPIKYASAFLLVGISGLGLFTYSAFAQPASRIDYLNSHRFQRCAGNSTDEVDAQLPFGFALTGIAVRAHSDEIRTVRLIGRRVRPDGTLGERYENGYGAAPSASTELQVEVPPGNVIIGLGADIDRRGPASQDFSHLYVTYQALGLNENGEVRLVGPTK